MVTVINSTNYTDNQLCSVALNCERHSEYPFLTWNVTFPDKPKPSPRPPQPPQVNFRSL